MWRVAFVVAVLLPCVASADDGIKGLPTPGPAFGQTWTLVVYNSSRIVTSIPLHRVHIHDVDSYKRADDKIKAIRDGLGGGGDADYTVEGRYRVGDFFPPKPGR